MTPRQLGKGDLSKSRPYSEDLPFPTVDPALLEVLQQKFPGQIPRTQVDPTDASPCETLALTTVRLQGQQDVIDLLKIERERQYRLSRE